MSKSSKINFFYRGAPELPDIRIQQFGYTTLSEWHFADVNSPSWILYRNQTSGCVVRACGQTFELHPDAYLLIPPFTVFTTDNMGHSMTQFHIHFSITNFRLPVRRIPLSLHHQQVMGFSSQAFFAMLDARTGNMRRIYHMLYSLIFAVLGAIPEDAFQRPDEVENSMFTQDFIRKANKHLNDPKFCQHYCEQTGISPSTLLRAFKRDTHMTPQQFRVFNRLAEVKNLLANTDLTLEDIAERTGFADRFHLSKMFRKYEHVAPATFRRNIQNFWQ